ncbi:hypothetical protein QAD02_010143 [Eretmocerus hayati]|uniref:Uncharacterized protein n=1 Tax=Eretmocerus hayati TaxID=131215 RepID=A0ACC2NBF9_9HYME|nr:hypothetical protein QAD02_010143 [Eretmocerus hayati]
MDAQDAEETTSHFWKTIENEIRMPVKLHVRNIFKHLALENHRYIKRLDDQSLVEELERFARGAVYKCKFSEIGTNDGDNIRFYGNWATQPEKFSFTAGEMGILKSILDLCKNRDDDFWKAPTDSQSIKRSMVIFNELIKGHEFNREVRKDGQSGSTALRMLNESLVDNYQVNKYNHRFQEPLKMLSMFIYLTGGAFLYKMLGSNFPIPSLETIGRYKGRTATRLEGECDINGFRSFVKSRGITTDHIFVSEDATKATPDVQYDARHDLLVGLVAPKDENAMPQTNYYKVTSLRALQEYFRTGKLAIYIYVFVIQPLQKDAPFYCFSLYGDDSCFTADDCEKRWKYLTGVLEQDFKVEGFASDGDPRLLKGMRKASHIDNTTEDHTFDILGFRGEYTPPKIFFQDFVHILTKLRNRLLKESIVLALGGYSISSSHLWYLVNRFGKDNHGLTPTILNNVDKMNFDSARKMCTVRVINLLKKVPGSRGTREYLTLMNLVMHAFLSTKLTPLKRLYCMAYSVFFLRLWRISLSKTMGLSVTHNFITINTYWCIEIILQESLPI